MINTINTLRMAVAPLIVYKKSWLIALFLALAGAALPFRSHAGGAAHVMHKATPSFSVDSSNSRKGPSLNSVPGEILVRYRPKSNAVAHAEMITQSALTVAGREVPLQLEKLSEPEVIPGLRLARVPEGETSGALQALKQDPNVIYAEPNYIWHKMDVPNDPEFTNQWGLDNTGQRLKDNYQSGVGNCPTPPCFFDPGISGADIRAEQAWSITHGSKSVVVGIVDEGIDVRHPDLKDNIWVNPAAGSISGISGDVNGYDFVHNTGSVFAGKGAYPGDLTDAHGTHVAGIVGASGNNTVGVSGVNWQVSLMSIKVLSPTGGKLSDIVRGLNYAKAMKDLWASSSGTRGANIRVLNNSYGGPEYSQAVADAITGLNASGVLFVAAAGNHGNNADQTPDYPGAVAAPNVMAVAASDQSDQLASFSNYGVRTVGLAAPGDLIESTTPNGTYDFYSGTSMASPYVAGSAALICAAFPQITVAQLRAALLYSGDAIPALVGKTYSNRRLNVASALKNAGLNDTTPPAAVSSLTVSAQTGRAVTLKWVAPGDDGNSGQAALYEIRFLDSATNATYLLGTQAPGVAGTAESATVSVPYQHTAGSLVVRAIDKAGNEGITAAVGVTVAEADANPYIVSESSATTLSTGGKALDLKADDSFLNYDLQFDFPFYGASSSLVTVSTNGALYVTTNPLSNGGSDSLSSIAALNGHQMIAGLWDDLRTDQNPTDDVYVVTPDANTVIFRWQAVTFDTPLDSGETRGQHPVNFEIELDSTGRIIMRYGNGNTNVYPVVGISSGEPDADYVASHTQELAVPNPAPLNLTNANTVTFAPRPVFSISGQISGDLTSGMSISPTVTLSGSKLASASIDPFGRFNFPNLSQGGNYTVTPSYSGSPPLRFDPPSQSFSNLGGNEEADFNAIVITHSISGQVTDSHGNGIPGVSLTWGEGVNGTSQTDSTGYYIFTGLAASRVYTITCASPNYALDPTFVNVTLNADTVVNFKATLLCKISGQIKQDNGFLVGDVQVNSNDNFTYTDPGGSYTMYEKPGGSYTITPQKNGFYGSYAYTPASTTFNNLSGDVVADFTATPLLDISGVVRDPGGNPITWVTVTVSGSSAASATSDGNGKYDLPDLLAGGNYTVTPSKAGYQFSPVSLTFTNLRSKPLNSVDFTGTVTGTNPIDGSKFFVTQHYQDFLNRDPDSSGLTFWVNDIASCGIDLNCSAQKRVDASAAFYLSIEFQETGYLVHRFYKAAYGRVPRFGEFLPDTQQIGKGVVVGADGWQVQLEANKVAYAAAWVNRGEFLGTYNRLTNAQYVDALIAGTQATFVQADRDSFVAALDNGSDTRAGILRKIAEYPAFYNHEFNSAFVLMQYFGYLRRNPDDAPDNNLSGYNFWLNKLNSFNGDFRQAEMVKAFILSSEYRARFGPS